MSQDLCTPDQVRLAMRLQPADTRDDSRIAQAISIVSAAMLTHLGRAVVLNDTAAETTEYFDGEGRSELALKEWPVQSIESLHDDPDRAYGSSTELDEGTDFVLDQDESGARIRVLPAGASASIITSGEGGSFFAGVRNVRVVYVPGYASRGALPLDLVGVAVTETIATLTKQPNAGAESSQAADISTTFDLSAWRAESLRVMARHRRKL